MLVAIFLSVWLSGAIHVSGNLPLSLAAGAIHACGNLPLSLAVFLLRYMSQPPGH